MSKITELLYPLRTDIPQFDAGDTINVSVKIREGDNEKIQHFEGIVIAKHGQGLDESFTVRKISFGVGVERTFPLHSPNVAKIEVAAKGDARRAKLYYLRDKVSR